MSQPQSSSSNWRDRRLLPARPITPLAAYALGAVAGVVPVTIEAFAARSLPALPALGGFALIGGLVSTSGFMLGRWLISHDAACRLSVAATGTLIGLELLFLLNVALLPNERSYALRSLAASLGVAAVVLAGTMGLARVSPGRARRHTRSLRILGACLFAASLILVAARWPTPRSFPIRQGSGPNILLIVIDAARRDHMSVYGYQRPTSLFLASAAPEARIYEGALAASSMTRASVPVLLGVRRSTESPTVDIQRLLAQAGYTSACFSDNPVLEDGSSVSAAFDHVELGLSSVLQWPQRVFEGTFVGTFVLRWPLLAHLWDDEWLTTKAIAWGSRMNGPVFLYVHLMDAHMPYDSDAIDGRGWSGRRLESPRSGTRVSESEAADIVAHYEGGLRNGDRQVARLLAAAATWGRPYLAIVTSDHGESLGENGRWGHSGDLAPERLAVPLIVLGDGVRPGRVKSPVGHRSVGRTILAAAGVACRGCLGSDLRVSDGDALVEGALPPNLYYRVVAEYKLIWNARNGQRQLFDIVSDPRESRDLSALHPELVRQLYAHGISGFDSSQPAAHDRERFRALGYIGP